MQALFVGLLMVPRLRQEPHGRSYRQKDPRDSLLRKYLCPRANAQQKINEERPNGRRCCHLVSTSSLSRPFGPMQHSFHASTSQVDLWLKWFQ